jgi:hypothetical protein
MTSIAIERDALRAELAALKTKPNPVRIRYMHDNHCSTELPLDVEQAVALLRAKFDAGETYGMLCSKQFPGNVHAGSKAEWPTFESAAREWLTRAVEFAAPTAQPVQPSHRVTCWRHCTVCKHDAIPGEGCARSDCPDAQPVQESRSQRMAAAGYTPRDRRLTCDECGAKFTAQMAPLHECAQKHPVPVQADPETTDQWLSEQYSKVYTDPAELVRAALAAPVETVPWPVVSRYSGGASADGVAGRVWLRLGDGPDEIEYVPVQAAPVSAKDARDAQRYRWLREHTAATGLGRFIQSWRKQFLDEAVDAALAAKGAA